VSGRSFKAIGHSPSRENRLGKSHLLVAACAAERHDIMLLQIGTRTALMAYRLGCTELPGNDGHVDVRLRCAPGLRSLCRFEPALSHWVTIATSARGCNAPLNHDYQLDPKLPEPRENVQLGVTEAAASLAHTLTYCHQGYREPRIYVHIVSLRLPRASDIRSHSVTEAQLSLGYTFT
jgi:hypothetical protein